MNWRRSKSLVKLMSQINSAYPERDTTSDGAIGDAAHATSVSDHNPWVKDDKGQPVVTAQDIDEDLNGKATLQDIVDAICESRDPRVKYIIYEGKITVKGSNLQKWQKYTGKNAHKLHAHISVNAQQKHFDDDAEWAIGVPKKSAALASTGVLPNTEQKPNNPQVDATLPAEPAPPVLGPQAQLPSLPAPVIEVEQVTAEKEAEKEVSGIQASTIGATTFITTTFGGVVAFLSDKGWQIVLGIAVVGAAFFIGRFWFANREKQRISDEKKAREQMAHEVQMATLRSAMDRTLNTVRVVPQPLENSDAETAT